MLSLRAHLIICLSLFVLIVLLALAAGALEHAGVIRDPAVLRLPSMIVFGALAVALAFSAVPVMVKLVLGVQRAAGAQDVPVVRSVLSAENLIIWVMWALMAAGLAIAIPAAIIDGALSP